MMSDLSNYYVIKKYKHGWVLGEINNNVSQFISREELIDMGYISETKNEFNTNVLGTSPPIIVPTISLNIPKKKKVKNKLRADTDPDWRSSKEI
jgi:hypothetical protein